MSTQHTARLLTGAVLEARMTAARRDGEATARAGEPRVNPWAGAGASRLPVDRVLARMWQYGYSAGNPIQLDDR